MISVICGVLLCRVTWSHLRLSGKLNLPALSISTIWIYRNYTIRGHWFCEQSEQKLSPRIVTVQPLLNYSMAIFQPRFGNNDSFRFAACIIVAKPLQPKNKECNMSLFECFSTASYKTRCIIGKQYQIPCHCLSD